MKHSKTLLILNCGIFVPGETILQLEWHVWMPDTKILLFHLKKYIFVSYKRNYFWSNMRTSVCVIIYYYYEITLNFSYTSRKYKKHVKIDENFKWVNNKWIFTVHIWNKFNVQFTTFIMHILSILFTIIIL